MGRTEKGRKNIPNKGSGTVVKKTNGFYSQFCRQEPLMDNNKMFTDLLLYGSHMAQYRAHNRKSLSICGIHEIAASFKKQSFVSKPENNLQHYPTRKFSIASPKTTELFPSAVTE